MISNVLLGLLFSQVLTLAFPSLEPSPLHWEPAGAWVGLSGTFLQRFVLQMVSYSAWAFDECLVIALKSDELTTSSRSKVNLSSPISFFSASISLVHSDFSTVSSSNSCICFHLQKTFWVEFFWCWFNISRYLCMQFSNRHSVFPSDMILSKCVRYSLIGSWTSILIKVWEVVNYRELYLFTRFKCVIEADDFNILCNDFNTSIRDGWVVNFLMWNKVCVEQSNYLNSATYLHTFIEHFLLRVSPKLHT